MSDIRRVVTGLDAEDRAVVQFDSQLALEPGPFGINSVNLWITDSYPAGFSFTHDTVPRPIGISPPDNGTKFRIVEFPPLDQATEAMMPPGLLHALVGDQAPKRGRAVSHPLMHRTRSVDYAIVLSGEVDLMLDETSVHLEPGDVIVQQATNHGWGQPWCPTVPHPSRPDGRQGAVARSSATTSPSRSLLDGENDAERLL